MPAVRLGRMVLHWCSHCDLPIVGPDKCSICGNTPQKVKHTPPGDIRPGFDFELQLIIDIIDKQFGAGCGSRFLPTNGLVIMNRAPDLDRLDEVIFDGQVQGALQFDLINGAYKFLPRLAGAKRFLNEISMGFVTVDPGAVKPICSGSNLLGPGIITASDGILPGDEVLVLSRSRELLGVGSAQKSTQDLIARSRGMGVKVRWHLHFDEVELEPELELEEIPERKESIDLVEGTKFEIDSNSKPIYQTEAWERAIKANQTALELMVDSAKNFILKTQEKFGLPTAVSFSGGKDSLATLMLVLETGIKPDLFFIDTGLEFPETVEHVNHIAEEFGLKLTTRKPINTFWNGLKYFGPPGKDFRWCCKTCKLGPTTRLIKEQYPGGVLSFIGQRRYESEQRSHKGAVWRNPWVPGQVGASPIQQWSALHVWLYIFSKGVEFNELYAHGLERIGCWLCPASDLADLDTVSSRHPDHIRWEEYLEEYSKKHSLSRFWIEHGLWRWKKLPKGIQQLIEDNNIQIRSHDKKKTDEIEIGGLRLHLADGYADCKFGLSLEGVFNKELDMERIVNLANILGKVDYDPAVGYCTINEVIDIFPEGGIVVKGKNEREIKKRASKIRSVVLRAMECISCGICIGRCENNALKTDDNDKLRRIRVDEDQCTSCGKCLGPCPVVDFTAVEAI